jgi:hypothetical protein
MGGSREGRRVLARIESLELMSRRRDAGLAQYRCNLVQRFVEEWCQRGLVGQYQGMRLGTVESVARLPLEVEKVLAMSLAIENERLGEVESVEKAPLEMVEKTFALPLAIENESLEDVQPENIEKTPLGDRGTGNVEKIPLGITERVFVLPLAIEKESLEDGETENVEEIHLGDRGTGNVEKAPLEM